jgi:hypothetical protein
MTGIIVPVLEKRTFEYGYLGLNATQEVVLHPAIEVAPWYRVRLVVRIHQLDAQSGNFKFFLFHTLPSEEDPQEFSITTAASEFFVTPSGAGGITTSSPNIVSNTAADPQAFLKLVLRATQATASNRLYGEFSAVLVLRDA